nr:MULTISPECIES: radical SAM protein [unclassified Ruminococcus]
MIIESCNLCPRECGGYRDNNIGGGFCGASTVMKVARIAPHYGEEPCISGEKGSGAVFFSHCAMKCIFCQNYEISHGGFGKEITSAQLAEKFKELEAMGVHNINLVNGTHYIPRIRESLLLYKPKIPVIFNCGGYEKAESLRLLSGLVDVYLPDFKYSDDKMALEYSGAKNYCETAIKAIDEMLAQTGDLRFDDNGMILQGTIIRHLVLPFGTKNSINTLKLIKEHFGNRAFVSLMAQYTPCGKAPEHKRLNRKITKREYQKVLDELFDSELDGYAQELESSGAEFIPAFDLTGV